MAADDLMREYEIVLKEVYGWFTPRVREAIMAELPVEGQISKAGKGRPPGTVESPGINWATGALRASVRNVRERDDGNPSLWVRTIGPTLDYASTYANGDPKIPSYHGYDFIEAARRRL